MRANASVKSGASPRIRCAVYTRKSTEEGLDQDFNSLDAQHEACAAYIASQRHEGWALVSDRYDDGGFSGGNMDRPRFRRLLDDVKDGRIDVIVVYKVDRLTRSLTDFAKIVEVLDGAGASFVSITQAFNTTTSMGRLTLNVLLSFAQFEREVIAERVRDKIAASKKKGIWMGGTVPLGYDVKDRKLVINEAEAETVRHIMRRYLDLGSVRSLMEDLKASGVTTKRRQLRDGSMAGGVPFVRGPLYHFLKNRIYIGEIPHRDQSYPGEHSAIVDRTLFDQVQAVLATKSVEHRSGVRAEHPSLLAGRIRDGSDRPMSPSHACRPLRNAVESGGRRYRYYTSNEATPVEDASSARVMRLPARALERTVIHGVRTMLTEAKPIHDRWTQLDGSIAEQARRRCAGLVKHLDRAPAQVKQLLDQLDLQIVVTETHIEASCSLERLLELAGISRNEIDLAVRVMIPVPTKIGRRGQELRLRFDVPSAKLAKRDPNLVALVVKAHQARGELLTLDERSTRDQRRELGRLARLSYLAPDIVAAILDGTQPADLTPRQLIRTASLPLDWSTQRSVLGFE